MPIARKYGIRIETTRHIVKTAVFLLLLLGTDLSTKAGTYTVKKGSTITVNCTATAPAGGWITHAFYSFVDPEDQNYLGISYTSSDLRATFYGLKVRPKIKIEVTYAYSYRGTYDNDIHVGHGTYYDYITVTGAPDATGVDFREGNSISLRPGTSIVLHADMRPKGADGFLNWGFVDGLGNPFCFDLNIASDGLSAMVTAKKKGIAYLIVMVDNDQRRCDVITLNCTDDAPTNTPTEIKISPTKQTLTIGETVSLLPSFIPSDAYAEVKWISSSPDIATVDAKGVVTALANGTTTITATVSEDVFATALITVLERFTSFSIPSSVDVPIGFTYSVIPVITPKESISDISWSTSSADIARVSASGVITAVSKGTCTITAKSKHLNISKDIQVTVSLPKSVVLDNRNIRQRIQAVKSLATQTAIED